MTLSNFNNKMSPHNKSRNNPQASIASYDQIQKQNRKVFYSSRDIANESISSINVASNNKIMRIIRSKHDNMEFLGDKSMDSSLSKVDGSLKVYRNGKVIDKEAGISLINKNLGGSRFDSERSINNPNHTF